MNLWQFLKKEMLKHAYKVAFSQNLISYNELIKIVESKAKLIKKQNKLIITDCSWKMEAAINILATLASGNVCVPINRDYGIKTFDEIKTKIDKDKKDYKDIAFIMFTSGTSGFPKGVMLSHKNVIENIKGISYYFKVSKADKILILRPLSHIAVLSGEFLLSLYKGLEISFFNESFNPLRAVDVIKNEHVTVLGLTPTLAFHLFRNTEKNELKLASCVLSGECLKEKVIDLLEEKAPDTKFYNVYGLTENSPRVTALSPKHFFTKKGSVGKPLLNTKLKIIDGELYIKSRSLMVGYYGEEKQKGYFKTNDEVIRDEKGFYYILGRKDKIIIRSGLNINPEEIENCTLKITGIENCLAYGVNDINYGQKVCLKFVGKATESEVKSCLIELLPQHMVPSVIIKVENLEATASGKLKRI